MDGKGSTDIDMEINNNVMNLILQTITIFFADIAN